MSKPDRKSNEDQPPVSPLEEEMADAVLPEEGAAPSPSEAELEAASIFTEDTPPEPDAPEAPAVSAEAAAELEALRTQADEYLDGWQRARAEFANYKKRIEREQEEARTRTTAAVITKILPIADDLERALRERPNTSEAGSWAEGIELIHRKLTALLDAEGVERIPAEGEPFNPELHEAVTYEASDDHNEGQVIEVIQQGYRLGERVLRPARVRVAK
ncbi:MAG TPA: nucleotide exchange factor GrpE [Anaerolineales bacterium]|nr:nucleotide exchange factor GrpE [Anaerolineales bacterium]